MTRQSTIVLLIAVCAVLSLACSKPSAPGASAPEPTPAPATPAAEPPAAQAAPAVLTPAELGKPAPDFTLTDTDGKSHTLSALKGKTVVLEWFNPDCPFVKFAHGQGELKTMATKVMGEQLIWLSINSGAPGKQGHGVDRNREAKGEYAMQNPILLDESGAVGKSYGAQKTPHLFVVDKLGTLIYRGAIDNAPIGKVDLERPRLPDSKEGQLVNYVSAAIEDVNAQRALRLADTPAYGCSVKYES
jgi:peroxiredoxin